MESDEELLHINKELFTNFKNTKEIINDSDDNEHYPIKKKNKNLNSNANNKEKNIEDLMNLIEENDDGPENVNEANILNYLSGKITLVEFIGFNCTTFLSNSIVKGFDLILNFLKLLCLIMENISENMIKNEN